MVSMIPARCLLVLVVCALTAGAHLDAQAAPSFEIAPPRIGPAPRQPQGLTLAASTTQFLAVWADEHGGGELKERATRVSPDGAPLDGVGIPLSTGVSQHWNDSLTLAAGSDGSDFVVISRSESLVTSAVITADGNHQVNEAALPRMYRATLVWLGSEYALVYVSEQFSIIRYLLLDRTGIATGPPRDLIATAAGASSIAAAIGRGSTFAIAWTDTSDGRVHVVRPSVEDLRRGSAAVIVAAYGLPRAGPSASDVGVASDGMGYLCVWTEEATATTDRTVHARPLTSEGVPSAEASGLGAITVYAKSSVAFDGSSYIVAFSDPERNVVTTRLQAGSAEPAFTQPMTVAQFSSASVVSNPKGSLLIWTAPSQEVMAAAFPIPAVGPSDPGRVISLGAAAQNGIAGEWRGDHYLMVWGEISAQASVWYGRFDLNGNPLDGTGVSLGSGSAYAIATDGRKTLVVWTDGVVKAAVIDGSGRATPPVMLSRNPTFGQPVVAWNGNQYVVLWTESVTDSPHRRQTVVARVGPEGNPLGDPDLVSASPLDPLERLIPIKDGYYVVIQTRTGFCFPLCDPPRALYATFLSPDLRSLGPAEPLFRTSESTDQSWTGYPSYTTREADVLVVWPQLAEEGGWRIRGARILGSGLLIDRPDGFAIGKGEIVAGAVATPAGFTVFGEAGSWNLSPDAHTISPADMPALVPPGVGEAPVPLQLVVYGGARPLLIYDHPPDAQHAEHYFVGAFPPAPRVRIARP
jgi:hypothetical protein